MRKTAGIKTYKVTEDGRTVHNEELHDLHSSPNIIRVIKSRRMGCAGHVARMGERRGAYAVLVGELEGKRSLGRPRRRLKDNIEMDVKEICWEGVDYIDVALDRDWLRAVVNAVMNLFVL
jgi:hypothetical protein